MKRRISFWLALLLSVIIFPAVLHAADLDTAKPDSDDEDGFSAYSVARLKIFEGSVWIRTPDSDDWEESVNNSPIPERSRISVPDDSEAEIQFHGGLFVLLRGGTEVEIRRLDDERSTFRLLSGELRFDLPSDDFAPVRILLPEKAKADFPVPGRYFVHLSDDDMATVTVRKGEASIATERGDFKVAKGEAGTISESGVRVGRQEGVEEGDDDASHALSEQEQKAGVPPAAAAELRSYGEWVDVPGYGYSWRPFVAVGWSPFTYGRWAWVSPWGWTWVAFEPWGWYPYRCGNWVNDVRFGWIWNPGGAFLSVTVGRNQWNHRRVVYYPANVRVVRDPGGIRWIPLRPGERWVRPTIPRHDTTVVRWDRPLPRETVYVRDRVVIVKEGDKNRHESDRRDLVAWEKARESKSNVRDRNVRVVVPGADRQVERKVSPPPSIRWKPKVERPTIAPRVEKKAETKVERPSTSSGTAKKLERKRDLRVEKKTVTTPRVAVPPSRVPSPKGEVQRESVRTVDEKKERGGRGDENAGRGGSGRR